MRLASDETHIIENGFGLVTNKRVVYFANKSWFGGGSREDVPLKQVVSIRYETQRSLLSGLVLLAIGAMFMVGNAGLGTFLFGVVLMGLGSLNLWGFPIVNIVTAGATQTPVRGTPWQRAAAQKFVSAVRSQLFQE